MIVAFTIIYLAGLIAILGWIVVGWTKYEAKHKIPEIVQNILCFILFIVIFFGGFWALNSYKSAIIEEYKTSQHHD